MLGPEATPPTKREDAERVAQSLLRNHANHSVSPACEVDEHGAFFQVTPEAGFVVKLAAASRGHKVFINVCHSPYLPAPPPATPEEIRGAIANNDSEAWRVPMSLAGPRDDVDKLGLSCVVYDVCVNSEVVARALEDKDFCWLVATLASEWVASKKNLCLLREDISLPRMKAKGRLAVHRVRRQLRAGVTSVPRQRPAHTLRRLLDAVEVLVRLPLLADARDIELDVERRRITVRHPLYELVLDFDDSPVDHWAASCDAVFDKTARTLRVSLPRIAHSQRPSAVKHQE